MILREILSRMQPNDFVKIGTEFGSNFIFAGTVEAVSAEMMDEGKKKALHQRALNRLSE